VAGAACEVGPATVAAWFGLCAPVTKPSANSSNRYRSVPPYPAPTSLVLAALTSACPVSSNLASSDA
jgi:hypothetical protein